METKLYVNLIKSREDILNSIKNKTIIYQFINLTNNKSYVGSAINGSRRFEAHLNPYNQKRTLGKGENLLYKAFLKYGYEFFGFKILEVITLDSSLSKVEQKALILNREDYFFLLLKPEYNLRKIANSNLGLRLSKKTRIKMSLAKLGKPSNNLGSKHSNIIKALFKAQSGMVKRIEMLNDKNELLATFDSIQIASEETGFSRNRISRCARGIRSTASQLKDKDNKYIFRFASNTTTP